MAQFEQCWHFLSAASCSANLAIPGPIDHGSASIAVAGRPAQEAITLLVTTDVADESRNIASIRLPGCLREQTSRRFLGWLGGLQSRSIETISTSENSPCGRSANRTWSRILRLHSAAARQCCPSSSTAARQRPLDVRFSNAPSEADPLTDVFLPDFFFAILSTSAWLRYALAKLKKPSDTSASEAARAIRSVLSGSFRKNLVSFTIGRPNTSARECIEGHPRRQVRGAAQAPRYR
jgi:hypothetical protein